MKYLHYFLIALMLLFAFFQWNDPDPQIWIPIYVFVALLGVLKVKQNLQAAVFYAVAFVYVLWGASLFPPEWEGVMLNEMGMKTINIELGRESLGMWVAALVLVAFGRLPNIK